jgi:hypothetical protein
MTYGFVVTWNQFKKLGAGSRSSMTSSGTTSTASITLPSGLRSGSVSSFVSVSRMVVRS